MATGPQSQSKTQRETYATLQDLQTLRREFHEDLSSFRHDVTNQLRDISHHLSTKSETNWTTVLAGFSIALVMAGMAGALVNSIISGEKTQREMAVDNLQADDIRDTSRIDKLLDRELTNSYLRGASNEKFETLQAGLDAAIKNRKDIDAKHVESAEQLSKRIDEMSHTLDNGLGRRIDEKMSPLIERIMAIEREVFQINSDPRDMDRK